MNNENSSFIAGMFMGAVIVVAILLLTISIKYGVQDKIENAKTEHLTMTYKNSKQGIADKEMLVNIMKQHFPSSNWSHVDTKAGERCIELDAWSADKQ